MFLICDRKEEGQWPQLKTSIQEPKLTVPGISNMWLLRLSIALQAAGSQREKVEKSYSHINHFGGEYRHFFMFSFYSQKMGIMVWLPVWGNNSMPWKRTMTFLLHRQLSLLQTECQYFGKLLMKTLIILKPMSNLSNKVF